MVMPPPVVMVVLVVVVLLTPPPAPPRGGVDLVRKNGEQVKQTKVFSVLLFEITFMQVIPFSIGC